MQEHKCGVSGVSFPLFNLLDFSRRTILGHTVLRLRSDPPYGVSHRPNRWYHSEYHDNTFINCWVEYKNMTAGRPLLLQALLLNPSS